MSHETYIGQFSHTYVQCMVIHQFPIIPKTVSNLVTAVMHDCLGRFGRTTDDLRINDEETSGTHREKGQEIA
eukprot:scaffold1072_cov124-Cylindrotheca_fusiformis.AAC.4